MVWKYLKKNGITIVLVIGIIVLIVNPQAKSWMLRQLMYTGIFNASIKTADTAPKSTVSIEFMDEKGGRVDTDSLQGKVVFINFWASWCPPCRAEMPSIVKMKEQLKQHPNVRILMVNEGEDPAKARSFLKKEGYDFSLYRVGGTIPEAIYSGVLPTTIILDKKGHLRYRHTGAANYGSEKFLKQIDKLLKE